MALVPWQATVQDDGGNAIPLPVVTVRNDSDASLATLYDIDGNELVGGNPITGDADGFVQFQVRPGRYTIDGAKDASSTATWHLDAVAGYVNFTSRADLVAAVADGMVWPDGTIITDGTVSYIASSGGTAISDLPGLLPFDPSGEFDCFVEHFVATSASAATTVTAGFQAAIDYVATIGGGTFGQGGKIGLKSREYVLTDTDADGFAVEIANSMTIQGNGYNSTTIYLATGITAFRVGKTDAQILADTTGTQIVTGVIFKDLQFFQTSASLPSSGSFILADRSTISVSDCRFINHFNDIDIKGSPEASFVERCDFQGGSNNIGGPSVAGSSGLAITRRRVNRAFPSAYQDINEINFDTLTGAFAVGNLITGGTSGATGTVQKVVLNSDGASGTLSLSGITDTFYDNEELMVSGVSQALCSSSNILQFDNLTGSFSVSDVVTGATSGASGTVSAVTTSGTTGTITLTGVTGIFTDNENLQVSSVTQAQANGGIYDNWYLETNSVYISDCNFRKGLGTGTVGTTQYGAEFSLRVEACDGLYSTNCHYAWGDTACIAVIAMQEVLGQTNLVFTGGLIDPHPDKTLNGVLVKRDNAAVGDSAQAALIFSGVHMAGCVEDMISAQFDISRLVVNGCDIRACGKSGITINDAQAKDLIITNNMVFRTNIEAGTNSAIEISACDTAIIRDNIIRNGYRGISVTGTPTSLNMGGNSFAEMTDTKSYFIASTVDSAEFFVDRSDIVESLSIASAGTITLPLGRDKFNITGTTGINNILTATSPTSAFDGREVTLVFADVVALTEAGNLEIGGGFSTAANGVLKLVYDKTSGKWQRVSYVAN